MKPDRSDVVECVSFVVTEGESGLGDARRRILQRAQHPRATFHEASFMHVSQSSHKRMRTMVSLGSGYPLRGPRSARDTIILSSWRDK